MSALAPQPTEMSANLPLQKVEFYHSKSAFDL
jgi:hypothetical protein